MFFGLCCSYRILLEVFDEQVRKYATAGVNYINILRAAFARVDPKSVKKYSYIISIFLVFWDLRL